jgi:hypothetical protein
MGLCAISCWCEGCRNKGKAKLSSSLDRISERITLAFQTLSRPEAIRGSTIEKYKFTLYFNIIWRRECPNQYISYSFTLVRRNSRSAYATGATCTPDLTRVHPNSPAILTRIWAGVWTKTFDGRLYWGNQDIDANFTWLDGSGVAQPVKDERTFANAVRDL